MIRKIFAAAAFSSALSACAYVDEYEAHVHDWAPVYCYQYLGGQECYRTPKHADARRLVNYYGPHPSRYDAPPTPPVPAYKAPETVNYWVKDPEPVPRPAPKGDLADRSWLTDEGRAETEVQTLAAQDAGTNALLRRISEATAAPGESTKAGTF